ncbi:HNH endonuclease signature motif containing protein [Mycolicibacterium confluentis]|uniref:HNH endonuclease signature motif containing protein n=2 Tax=Mycolicibacterium confluentis TaxID=28047 RepID=UPI0013D46150|nr:HNH endonuclease signature motif containing protein [Mycolicibacterium confluentis]
MTSVADLLSELEAVHARLAAASVDGLSALQVLTVMERLQKVGWSDAAVDHKLVARLQECGPEELGGDKVTKVLTHRLRIPAEEARQRVADAAVLSPRHALTGEVLEPVMPHVAAAVAEGRVGPAHVKSCREFFKALPDHVDLSARVEAEKLAAEHASTLGVPDFRAALNRMLLWLDPDGSFNDADIQRRRGLTFGKQGADGLIRVSGHLTPEAWAVWEPVMAKNAAPGMCNPDDENPCVTGRPTEEQIKADHRTKAQRQHDALLAGGRTILASKKLGKLNGLPVTVVVTTTLKELQSGAGFGITGGGSLLPMRDLIRMASHAFHYLSVFDDDGQALYLGRAKRIATPAQRLVLFSKERGCSAPGCTASFYQCQVHHAAQDWIEGGETNVNELTLACGTDNRKVGPEPEKWTTRIRDDGRCEWIPPPHLDNGGPRVNDHHHPENLLNPYQEGNEGRPGSPQPGADDPDGN